jgi:hypothetical protein
VRHDLAAASFSTVTGTCSPVSVKTRVMPSFCAMTPERIVASCSSVRSLELDLDVDAGGQVELHQRVDGLRRRIDDVEKTLVRAHFELLAALLVDVRRAVDGELLDAGRQRNRPRTCAPVRLAVLTISRVELSRMR